MHIVLRMRRAAQEGEIGRDAELGVGGRSYACSCEQPVQEPARRGRQLAAVTARRGTARSGGPRRPRRGSSRASAPCRPCATIPWRCAPALRRARPDERRAASGSGAAGRRAPRQGHLDRLGRLEQPQRARRRLAFGARGPGGLRRPRRAPAARARPAPRARGCGCPAARSATTRSRAEARRRGGRSGARLVIVLRRRLSRPCCCGTTISVRLGGKPDQVEAEAGIERIGQRIEPLAKQPQRSPRRRVSGWPVSTEDRAHRAVGAEEARFEPPRALALRSIAATRRLGELATASQRSRRRSRPARRSAVRPGSPAAACAARSARRPAPSACSSTRGEGARRNAR